MYRLVIFDFDDTLLTLGVRWAAVKKDVLALAEREGVAVDSEQGLVPLGNSLSSVSKLKKAIDAIYLKHEGECVRNDTYAVYPGMFAIVRELKASGRMAAISSGNHSSTIKRILAKLNMPDSFNPVCGRDSVKNNKPSPDQPNLILKKLAVAKEDALFVGDSINDEGAARAAGIDYFKIRPGDKSDIERLRKLLF